MAYNYELLNVSIEGHLAVVSISNPPINLITLPLYAELSELSIELKADPDLTVVVFKSLDADFFIAHFDVEAILQFPIDQDAEKDLEPNPFHALCERMRTMDKVTIAQIEGRVGGGGSEFVSSMDMRFGVQGKTIVNQMEVPLGILPGGTGTQRLPRLVGRGRAMEIILGGGDIDAHTAERWGYLNRIFKQDEIDTWVMDLARRIAGYPPAAVRLAKESINAAQKPLQDGLVEEAYLFQRLLRTDAAQNNMRNFMALGGQTREGELRVVELVEKLNPSSNI
ncbi:MAG: enoyl-CoA hydratase/isomerase family protein [Gammaproteobacteria bacterium]|nr:enoyl-CoA hydratase/isomerase family protein [Gammaproteobacteria bacterium]